MAAIGRNMCYFLLLNTIINPYYHSCGFMTDIYLTFRLFYTQRRWHTSELFIDIFRPIFCVNYVTKYINLVL